MLLLYIFLLNPLRFIKKRVLIIINICQDESFSYAVHYKYAIYPIEKIVEFYIIK